MYVQERMGESYKKVASKGHDIQYTGGRELEYSLKQIFFRIIAPLFQKKASATIGIFKSLLIFPTFIPTPLAYFMSPPFYFVCKGGAVNWQKFVEYY